ncbi:MAG: putative peptidoglycan glycosyltransferase FtsW [bacterium]|jgi:cell division protein FtsW|nr:putative peptidoglycan glycosyltransferase FtsW [bacterium]
MFNARSFVVSALCCLTILLVMVGVIMVLSSSFKEANVYGYMGRQLIWFSIGLAGMFYFSNKNYNIWEDYSRWIMLATLILLSLVFFFPEVNGAHRWIRVLGFSFQPSDAAKLSLIIYLSATWANRLDRMDSFIHGALAPLGMLIFTLALVVIEPDHSTTFFICVLAVIIWFAAGGRLMHLTPALLLMLAGIFFMLYTKPHLFVRIDAFLHPENYQATKAYQLYTALVGFAHGGLWGVGIGEGMQKLGFTPEPHTDFIFSTMGEELGFVWCSAILGVFLTLITLGYLTAMRCTNPFGRLVAVGCTSAIGLQAVLNIAVVTGTIPTTGISLPFISYGGSSLVISMTMVGLLMNIAKETFGVGDIPVRGNN